MKVKNTLTVGITSLALAHCGQPSTANDDSNSHSQDLERAVEAEAESKAPEPEKNAIFGVVPMELLDNLQDASEISDSNYRVKLDPPEGWMDTGSVFEGTDGRICALTAVTVPNESDEYGTEVRRQFESTEEMLTNKYGKATGRHDELLSGSIWSDPRYFRTSLAENERLLNSVWILESDPRISSIGLEATASGNFTLLRLRYEFANFEECQSAYNNRSEQSF